MHVVVAQANHSSESSTMLSETIAPFLLHAFECVVAFVQDVIRALCGGEACAEEELHGTAFIVKAGSDSFLVSAAHVTDTAYDKGVYFFSSPSVRRHVSGKLLRTGPKENRSADLIDIGVVKLDGGAPPPYPDVNKFAMDLSYLRPGYRPRTGKSYALIGFPATKSRTDPHAKTVEVKPHAFRLAPIDETEYARHGVSPDTHVVLQLDLRRGFGPSGNHQHFPKPQGMSGAPIIVLYEHEGEGDARVFPVVGVATTYRTRDRVLIGTDIGFVIDAMRRAA
jgi:hypothetical protein